MAKHVALSKALRQMAEGSQSAFHTFYLGSSQYIYNSALLLYGSHGDACQFMIDFYQYLYLHLPEYQQSEDLEHWISRQLLARYEQLSIGKNMPKPSMKQQMHSTTAQLSKSEQERIWRILNENIHFPKETIRRSPVRIALAASLLLLLLLVASRYAPAVAERLQSLRNTPDSGNAADDEKNPDSEDEPPENDSSEDELDAIQEKINDLANEHSDSDAEAADDDTDEFTQHQQTGVTDASSQTSTPSEPDAPQTPDEPQEPQEPEEPTMSEGMDSLSGIDDLENLELELRYGDSLLY